MIQIDFSFFICYYLIGQIAIIWILWFLPVGLSFRRAEAGGHVHVWQCSTCFHVYVEPRVNTISPCPLCGSLNKKAGLARGEKR
ncbi:MAG: hypothetical protein V1863_06815 [Candidatus Omnitrophota bacterium]